MTKYHVIGTKTYSKDVHSKLSDVVFTEQKDIMNGLKSWTQEVPIELFSITGSHINAKSFNDRHGEHSHYYLLNEYALNALKQYDHQVDVIDDIDLIDPMSVGFSLLIRNSRFI
ncbi:hypothetical protein NSQ29_01185 [Paenibacillus sp. FSL F4-0236]|uniref:hypothetical protein n=1 Tax=Paenibacillus sp. FSL F4-0236 TaxID=2954731 RepID=UPI0030FA8470